MIKMELNSEREFLFQFVWLVPLIPMTVLICFKIYIVIIIAVIWFVLFGFVFSLFHCDLFISDNRFILKTMYKEYVINFNDILFINETKKLNNSFVPAQYKIVLRENSQIIPKRFLMIQNKKFTKIYSELKFNTIKSYILE